MKYFTLGFLDLIYTLNCSCNFLLFFGGGGGVVILDVCKCYWLSFGERTRDVMSRLIKK